MNKKIIIRKGLYSLFAMLCLFVMCIAVIFNEINWACLFAIMAFWMGWSIDNSVDTKDDRKD